MRKTRAGRMVSVSVTLSDWLYRAVLSKSVLTLNRAYFTLRRPLERRLYELARKHCGSQPDWPVAVSTLWKKSGSTSPIRVFRAMLRDIIKGDTLPDYTLTEEPGDRVRVRPRGVVLEREAAPLLSPETYEAARALIPGADIYALEIRWQAFWVQSGRPHLRSADKAFLGWLRTQRP